jgi:hypothetical protein
MKIRQLFDVHTSTYTRLGGGKSRDEYIRIMQSLELEKTRLSDVAVPGNQACGLVRQG